MRVVQVRRVLRCLILRMRDRDTPCRVSRRNIVRPCLIPLRIAVLIHLHVRYLQDESQGVLLVDVPVVSHLHHVVLKTDVVSRFRQAFRHRRLAVRGKIHIVLRVHLRQLTEGIGLLSTVVQIERYHIHVQPSFDITEIHTSVTGTQHTVQTLHHVPLRLDVDDSAGSGRIVFGTRVRDDLYLLNRVAVRSV